MTQLKISLLQSRDMVQDADSSFELARNMSLLGAEIEIIEMQNGSFAARPYTKMYSRSRFNEYFTTPGYPPKASACLIRLDPPITFETANLISSNLGASAFINNPLALAALQDKSTLSYLDRRDSDAQILRDLDDLQAARAKWGDIVIRKRISHAGKSVQLLRSDDNIDQITYTQLRSPDKAEALVASPFYPEICQGEVRSIFVGNQLAGTWRKVPQPGEWRVNFDFSPTLQSYTPPNNEAGFLRRVSRFVSEKGILFFAIDYVRTSSGPKIIEINVCNPGGIVQADETLGTRICKTAAKLLIERVSHL
ncbi:ATP-grasp domain-containing protein [Albimonas donghaensis]|uniref:ATP-grasp domain-containing protein n=1 Tax=Albimonas donghaensis TaxID=356660 RepID=UPI001FE01C68|nr:hypothetical protein [Albimonas donghaensis]